VFKLINSNNESTKTMQLGFKLWIFQFLITYSQFAGHSFGMSFILFNIKLAFQFGTVNMNMLKNNTSSIGKAYDA
jgi:hypothetical protein